MLARERRPQLDASIAAAVAAPPDESREIYRRIVDAMRGLGVFEDAGRAVVHRRGAAWAAVAQLPQGAAAAGLRALVDRCLPGDGRPRA